MPIRTIFSSIVVLLSPSSDASLRTLDRSSGDSRTSGLPLTPSSLTAMLFSVKHLEQILA